jgi:hypothetical protein
MSITQRERTNKNCPAVLCRPTMKYKMTPYGKMVMNVMGMSTRVMASASTNGWYIAAFAWRSTIGRCENNAGTSEEEESAGRKSELEWGGY